MVFFSYYSIGERKNAEKALFDLKENEIQGAYTRIHQIVHDDGHGRLNFGSPTVASDKACDYDAFRNLITEKKLECF